MKNTSDYFRQNNSLNTAFTLSNSWVVLNDIESSIQKKIQKVSKPLKDWDVQINYGIKTGFNTAFIINEKIRNILIEKSPKSAEIIRPILRGKDIKKYGILNQKEWIIIIPCGWTNQNCGNIPPEIFFKQTYPAIYEYLIEKSLIPSKGKGLFNRDDQGNYWWELRPCDYLKEFEKEKILYIDIMTDNEEEGYPFPCFSYAKNGIFTLNTAYFMVGNADNLKYILGVLNSKVGKFIVRNNVTPLQKRQYRMFQQFVDKFPIPKTSIEIEKKIIKLVDEVINLKESGLNSETKETEITELCFSICELNSIEKQHTINQD
ncbi:MAG TPA: TaqI-like C-terminal specificity domain-containing protein [Flavipsychrobacter sp.]|nr:TaqI-like C-terminal specificity domain-containing protein [Flavipsychrobacter sp.]